MGPRKKARLTPKANSDGDEERMNCEAQRSPPEAGGSTTPHSTQTWYGGTWPRLAKANPVTQLARESISAASGAATDLVSSARSRDTTPVGLRSPSRDLIRSISTSTRSLPLAATTTKLNITSSASQDQSSGSNPQAAAKGDSYDKSNQGKDRQFSSTANESLAQPKPEQIPLPTPDGEHQGQKEEDPQTDAGKEKENGATLAELDAKEDGAEDIARPSSALPGWRGWFIKGADNNLSQASTKAVPPEAPVIETQQPSVNTRDMSDRKLPPPEESGGNVTKANATDSIQATSQQARPWFGLWGSTSEIPTKVQASQQLKDNQAGSNQESAAVIEVPQGLNDQGAADKVTEDVSNGSTNNPPDTTQRRSSGWAFWSRKQGESDGSGPANTKFGELAVADTPSQSQPETARIEGSEGTPSRDVAKPKKEVGQPRETVKDSPDDTAKSKIVTKSTPSKGTAPSKAKMTDLVASKQLQKALPNLVLPAFKSTYSEVQTPSILQQITRLLVYSDQPTAKHVSIVRDPPRIKKALAIGVHGYFPAPVIRSVLGQPTGTSIRFADSAAHAIESWTQGHGYSCEIQKIALEGEGKIAERVEILWKLMLNWIDQISKADFILVACHSQGVPVAMMLVAKLINLSVVSSAKVGVCAMAGVNLGPFADYKSRFFSNGSAGELFEFSKPESTVSRIYEESLRIALKHGVRITFIGSIDDQLVSLESSTFSNVSHPYIFRAVFVDGRVHAPDFITHLVGFALKLRNLGLSDHGLIRELSSPLAGSLYSGEGHSRIYDDDAVYLLAVEHALESSSVGDVPLEVQKYDIATNHNPYILPWAARGLLEEEYVRTHMQSETTELLEQFDNWKPASKVLRDVKFRLEAVKSKL